MGSRADGSRIARRVLAVGGASAVALGSTLGLAGVASAAYPGANGLIVFTSSRGSGGDPSLYLVNPQSPTPSSTAAALTSTSADDFGGFFSPDGSKVVFFSDRTGNDQIWTVSSSNHPAAQSVDGSSPATDGPTLLFNDPGNSDDWPSYAPDGQTIAFVQNANSIEVLSPGSSTPVTVSSSVARDQRPVFDPVDGSKLLYVSSANHIILVSGIGSATLTSTDLTAAGSTGTVTDQYPDWYPGGQRIVFDSNRPVNGTSPSVGTYQIWSMAANGTGSAPLFSTPTGFSDTKPVASPDGTRVAFDRTNGNQDVYATSSMSAPSATTLVDLTTASGNPADYEPDWAPSATVTPPSSVPESPWTVALPLAAASMIGGAYMVLRRRPRSA